MAITFDTLEYVNELKSANVPEAQAEAQAKAMRRVLDSALENQTSALATKADLAYLENRFTLRFGAMLVVGIGILLAVLPMLIAK